MKQSAWHLRILFMLELGGAGVVSRIRYWSTFQYDFDRNKGAFSKVLWLDFEIRAWFLVY